MPAMKLDGYNMDAIYWWEAYGSETPNLAVVRHERRGEGHL